jgi:hypothetical protein
MTDHTDGEGVDWEAREKIFDKAQDHRNSIYYTYQRNYFAAKCVGWLGWALDGLTALFGGVLIYILRTSADSQASVYLAIGILSTSLISSFYGPKLRSRDYYQAGQEHQELYDEFVHFICLDVGDSSISDEDLRGSLEELNGRRHRLNQSTPQLGGIWYYSMKLVGKMKWAYSKLAPWKEERTWDGEEYGEVIPEGVTLEAGQ